jgi:hypothetical protein
VEPPDGRLLEGAVHAFDLPVIRHGGLGVLISLLTGLVVSLMVRPSGTWGAGSTQVRAGRR